MEASKYEGQAGDSVMPTGDTYPSRRYIFTRTARNKLEIFLTCDGEIDFWRKIGETDDDSYDKLFIKGEVLYLLNTFSNTMKTFHLLERSWHDKNSARTNRQDYSVVADETFIFVLGGFTLSKWWNISKLPEIHKYNPDTDTWSQVAKIPINIKVLGASVVNNKLYVIGFISHDRETHEMKAFVYDKVLDTWYEIGNPKKLRMRITLVNFHERLYLFGRETGDVAVTTAEVYRPEEGDWKAFPALPFPYHDPRAAVLKDKLMVYENAPTEMSIYRFPPCVWNEELHLWEVERFFFPSDETYKYQFYSIEDRSVLQELAKQNEDPETIWSKTPFASF